MSTTAIRPQGVTNSFKVPTDRQPENAARREDCEADDEMNEELAIDNEENGDDEKLDESTNNNNIVALLPRIIPHNLHPVSLSCILSIPDR